MPQNLRFSSLHGKIWQMILPQLNLISAALSRYQDGQELIQIVQDFQKITQQIRNHFAAWIVILAATSTEE